MRIVWIIEFDAMLVQNAMIYDAMIVFFHKTWYCVSLFKQAIQNFISVCNILMWVHSAHFLHEDLANVAYFTVVREDYMLSDGNWIGSRLYFPPLSGIRI